MLAGFLAVLKIIGIVLICILAFLLVLILLVLFVPIFYRADYVVPGMDLDEGFDVEKVNASARFSWLLFVIRGGIEFPVDKTFTLRVFGIKILPKNKKAGEEEAKEDKKEKNKDKDKDKKEDAGEGGAQNSESKDPGKEENASEQTDQTAAADTLQEAADQSADMDTSKEDDEKSFLDVLWSIFDGIDNFLKTPINVFEKMQYTISRVCGKIDMIKSTIESDIFKRAFDLVKDKLFKVIKMILPDKTSIDLLLGTGDPASMAELMGVYGALYPVLFGKVRLTPDFEDKIVASEGHIKGHITIFTIVYCAAICFFNKDVRKTVKRFKTIIK